MEELDKYIEQIKERIKQIETKTNEPLKEEEIIMLVYIDLGKRFFFDVDIMLGNQKKIEEIYRNDFLNYNLDEKFKSGKITCRTASKILEYILKKLGIKIETKTYDEQDNRFAHTYNVIYPRDRGESYKIDLQNDLKNIQFHTMTKNSGRKNRNLTRNKNTWIKKTL